MLALVLMCAVFLLAAKHPDKAALQFELTSGKTTSVIWAEVAETPEDRAKGLMFRRELQRDHGMLFIFPKERNHSFWMKNTYISLDLIFMDKDMRVVGILKNLPVLNKKSQRVKADSKYVLEVNAGVAEELVITEGATLKTDVSQ